MNIEANGISVNTQVEGAEGAPWVTFSTSLACNRSMWYGRVAAGQTGTCAERWSLNPHGPWRYHRPGCARTTAR